MSPDRDPELRTLSALTWPDVEAVAARSLLVVPLGATEQHGPHLPIGTDTAVAAALAGDLAARRDDVVLAPPLPYGASGEHAGSAGTLSVGREALRAVLVELVRSADAFAGVVLVSGHGGNATPLQLAVATSRAEGRRALAWAPTLAVLASAGLPADAHAGRSETSLLLALRPGEVRPERAEPGPTGADLGAQLRARGVLAVSPNGVLGDPAGAGPDEGRRILAVLGEDLAVTVEAWRAGWPA